jgi:hypothetical protein
LPRQLQSGLLGCGVLSSLLYVAVNFLGARRFPGYSLTSQTISELFAIGAPSRRLVASLMVLYDVLLYAFGVGVWRSAHTHALRIAAVGMIGKEVLGFLATVFFPMHRREVLARGGATVSDELHKDFTLLGTVFMLATMVSGAAAFGGRFRGYSIGTMLAFVVGGLSAFGDVSRMAANLPTPGQGLRERANAFGYMAWVAVLALILVDQHHRTRGWSLLGKWGRQSAQHRKGARL